MPIYFSTPSIFCREITRKKMKKEPSQTPVDGSFYCRVVDGCQNKATMIFLFSYLKK